MQWTATRLAGLTILTLVVAVPLEGTVKIEELYGKSYALVVGIDEYKSSEAWPKLPFARKDAKKIASLLNDQGFDEVIPLYDENATRTAIISALEDRIAPQLQADDRIVVFFSGHGTTRSFGGRDYGYLIPYDAGARGSATWLSMRELRGISEKLRVAKHQLFILDSCFGGTFATKSGSSTIPLSHPDYIQDVARRFARQFLTAGGREQKVRDAGPHGYSYFTGYLVEALEKGLGDTNGDGYITALELAQYLQSRATNDDQTPGFGDLPGHGLGAFLFAAPGAKSKRSGVSPQRVVSSLGLKGGVEVLPIEEERSLLGEVKLREAPMAAAPAVTRLPSGTRVWVAGRVKDRDWLLVEYKTYRGYVLQRSVGSSAGKSELGARPIVLGWSLTCEGAEDCFKQGLDYHHGRGQVPQSHEKAAVAYYEACSLGDTRGCTELGLLFHEGLGVAADLSRARSLYQQGCDGGIAQGCTNLGFLYEASLGVAKDYARVRSLYQQGCDGGHAWGCTNLGVLYEHGFGVAEDLSRARSLYQQGCDSGNAVGCTNLGLLYEKGLGVAADLSRARSLYQQGCDGGTARGCTNLGVLYETGLGVAEDHARARSLYQQGCDGGHAWGCTNLGVLYENGLGVAEDLSRARSLYQQGCDGGNAGGCSALAHLKDNS